MGIFAVKMKLRKWQYQLPPEGEGAEELVCEALVDTGSLHLGLPTDLIEQLDLVQVGRRTLRTADGRRQSYRLFGVVDVEVQGRDCQVRAIELPKGAIPLLGAIPLEDMDWHVSPSERKLIPNPLSLDGEPMSFA